MATTWREMPTVKDRPDDDARGKHDLVVWVNQRVHSPIILLSLHCNTILENI